MSENYPSDAKPEPWQSLRPNEVEAYRNLACPYYSDCLDLAAYEKWEGFTCIFCGYFNTRGEGQEAPLANREELLISLQEIFRRSRKGLVE